MSADTREGSSIARNIDGALRIGLVALLTLWCFRIVQPFLVPILWGAIIAIGTYPGYRRVDAYLNGRSGLAAFVFTVLVLVALLVPTFLLSGTVLDSARGLSTSIEEGTLSVPPPPKTVATWPFIGEKLAEVWGEAAQNLDSVLEKFKPQLKSIGAWMVGATAKGALALLLLVFSIIIAGIFQANANASREATVAVANRLFGERGEALVDLGHATIVSVARGILGIAVLQTFLAGLGFVLIDLPGAGLWALICLILAVVQIDILLVLIPLSIYAFSTESTVTAIVFLVWNVAVGLLNNVLKPILLGRGVDAPMVIVFMGAIGGLLLSGIIGLFVGAVILVLGFKLFQAWLEQERRTGTEPPAQP